MPIQLTVDKSALAVLAATTELELQVQTLLVVRQHGFNEARLIIEGFNFLRENSPEFIAMMHPARGYESEINPDYRLLPDECTAEQYFTAPLLWF
jgi:hypothetical protein